MNVISMTPIEAFWHERFGLVIVFRAECDPPMRDYVIYAKRSVKESGAKAGMDGFILGYTKKDYTELPKLDAAKWN